MTPAYWFATRSKQVEHQHPYLVFDCQDRLHLPLTVYGKEASQRLSPKTVQTYLHAILPWFTWLETDAWQVRVGLTWNAPTLQVQQAVEDYLVSKLQCKCSYTDKDGSLWSSPQERTVRCAFFLPL